MVDFPERKSYRARVAATSGRQRLGRAVSGQALPRDVLAVDRTPRPRQQETMLCL